MSQCGSYGYYKGTLMAEITLEAKLTCPECQVVHKELMLADD
jgi:hypothetical protein